MHPTRTTTRPWLRAVLSVTTAAAAGAVLTLTPTASAAPSSAAQARELVQKAGEELTTVDEQVRQAELTVAELQGAATAAAGQAAVARAAVDAFQPRLRAIAQVGYTGTTQSRMAAFLTSDSAAELVQQMTTLDLIADHTNEVIADVATAQDVAERAQQDAEQAAGKAQSALGQLHDQQAQLEQRIAGYEADFDRLSAAEQAAVTSALAGPTLAAPRAANLAAAPTAAAAAAVKTALAQIGDRYAWGKTGPDSFDCSGLTMYAYAAAGVPLPHSSQAQSRLGRAVSRAELQPGDLVFWYKPISHVGIYIGNGMMVHARTTGSPVAVTSVDHGKYATARRLV